MLLLFMSLARDDVAAAARVLTSLFDVAIFCKDVAKIFNSKYQFNNQQ